MCASTNVSTYLGIDNHQIIQDQVWNEFADEMPPVVDGEGTLMVNLVTACNQLNDQGVSYNFSSNPGLSSLSPVIAALMMSLLNAS